MNTLWAGVVLFLFGLGANLYVRVVGYLAFSEVALILIAPVVLFASWSDVWRSNVRPALLLAAVWLFAAIVSDQVNGTYLELAFRGWARPVFIAAAILVMYRLLKPDPKLLQWFFLGLAISSTIGMYAFKNGSIDSIEQNYDVTIEGSFEKQIIEIIVPFACFGMVRYGGAHPYGVGISMLSIGAASIAMGSRSAGALLALSGIAVVGTFAFLPVASGRFRMSKSRLAGLGLATVFAGCLLYFGYESAAAAGLLGEDARSKYYAQSDSRFGLLIGGRLDFLGGLLAVSDRPFIGHGSWPLDSKGYLLEAAQIANVELDQSYAKALATSYVRIPTHSHILETWVEHGVLATLFWWFVLWAMIRCAVRGAFVRPDLVAAAIVLLLLKSWDFLFSPVGLRVSLGAIIAFFILLNEQADSAMARADQRTGVTNRVRQSFAASGGVRKSANR